MHDRFFRKSLILAAFTTAMSLNLAPAFGDEVGRIGVDWVGNDIIVEAVEDPDIAGVTCHVSYFERSLIDRLQKGNWFEDPSNSSIACRQTGPIAIGDIDLSDDGEEIFNNRRSTISSRKPSGRTRPCSDRSGPMFFRRLRSTEP